jgi:hypothetical protein
MSTLPPTPSFNANIPVVTSSGGTSAAYKDPNSPESIMKKTTLVKAQAAVDTTFDVNQVAVKDGFKGFRMRGKGSKNDKYISIFFLIAVLFILFSRGKNLRAYAKVFFSFLAAILIIITIILQQNGKAASPASPASPASGT